MRKLWFLGLITLAIGLLLVGCAPVATPAPAMPQAPTSPAASEAARAVSPEEVSWAKVVVEAKKEGKLTWYGTVLSAVHLPVTRAFEDRYGIKVDVLGGRGAEWLERLRTEKRMGQIVGDITEGSSSHTESMRQAGILASSADIPVFQEQGVWNQEPWVLDQERKYFKYNLFYLGPHINTKLVSPEEAAKLKSWHDFLDPRWKGRMSLVDPILSVSSNYFIMYLKLGLLDQEFLRALGRQQIKFSVSPTDDAAKLARGEIDVALMGSGNSMPSFINEGAPIKALDMKEGVVTGGSVFAAINNSPHPNAAKVFLNWIFSKEGQTLVSQALLNKPVRKGAPDFTPEPLKVEHKNPVEITTERNEWIAQAFQEKQLIPFLKPK